VQALERLLAHAQARQTRDTEARTASAQLQVSHRTAEAERQLWGRLDALIGSSEGDAFRQFAQSLTLDAVIAQANHHLKTLARRYRLMRVPGEDLALQIIDRHMGDEVRTVKSLSGGETFLVSLALALGLASLSAQDTRIESLFIDEGFGTLDTDTLDVVLDALDALQAAGRQIGLISHVPGLAQRIGVQVCIEPTTSGISTVRVEAGWGA
jgi:exonuclease SbcC